MIRKLSGRLNLSPIALTDRARSGDRFWVQRDLLADSYSQVQADPNTPVVLNGWAPFYWAYRGEFYVTQERLLPEDVIAYSQRARTESASGCKERMPSRPWRRHLTGSGGARRFPAR